MTVFELFFGYRGRLNRAKYWLTAIVYVVVALVPLILMFLAIGPIDANRPFGDEVVARIDSMTGGGVAILIASVILLIVVSIATLISSILVGIRRLHDRDKSGWWILTFYFLPGLCTTVADELGEPSALLAFLLYIAAFGVTIWALVELGFLRGTDGANRFGPDPRSPARRAALY